MHLVILIFDLLTQKTCPLVKSDVNNVFVDFGLYKRFRFRVTSGHGTDRWTDKLDATRGAAGGRRTTYKRLLSIIYFLIIL